MAQQEDNTEEFRLVRIMGRQAWYVRYREPGASRSIVKSTGETNREAAEKWLEQFKTARAGEAAVAAPTDARFKALVKAWEAADADARGRFVLTLLTPIIGGK